MIFRNRYKHLPVGRNWDAKEIKKLAKMVHKGYDLNTMAKKLNRTEWAVNNKINEWRILK